MKSEGECNYCKKVFNNTDITKHILSCKTKEENDLKEEENNKVLLIKAGDGPFWIYFEVNSSSKLKKIDDFLRNIWLECCGHLSMFKIRNTDYFSECYEIKLI